MGVYIVGKGYATQGPAPDGFHVPLNTEWQAIVNIWTALGGGSTDSVNFSIALKLPFAGARDNSYADVYGQGDYGYYWSSSRYDAGYAYILFLYRPDGTLRLDTNARARGYSVRCFKNSPAIPTSSWTKLYGTSIESGGIFWSSNEGLISLSSDGQTWITIQDKNLGATQLWNSGDTLSEANCGKYYQWGNNYGFPRTGSVTTSLTQVDASSYGPGNYYSSNTFILKRSSPYRWDTTDNANLRGGEDGNVPTMSELKNAYIGEYRVPGDNTYMYWELVSNTNDTSGNNRNGTVNGTVTWNNGAVFAGSGQISSPINSMPTNFTISCWVKKTQSSTSEQVLFAKWGSYYEYERFGMLYDGSGNLKVRQATGSISGTWLSVGNYGYNTWHNVVFTKTGTTITIYVNGNQTNQFNYVSWSEYTSSYLGIGGWTSSQSNFNGAIKDFIVENKVRTAQEIANYYNSTKSDYGL